MSSAAKAFATSISFNALDPDLPFLAASAALELDNVLIGTSTSTEHVEQLMATLSSAFSTGQSATKKFLDPISCTILTRALSESGGSGSAQQSDLTTAISRLSERLEGIKKSSTKKEQVSELRDFFVALSRLASTSRKTLYGDQRVHSYRK